MKKPRRYTAASSQHRQTSGYHSNHSQIARSTLPQNDPTEDSSHPNTIFNAVELGSTAPTLIPLNDSNVLSHYDSMPANFSSQPHERSSSISIDINDLQFAWMLYPVWQVLRQSIDLLCLISMFSMGGFRSLQRRY